MTKIFEWLIELLRGIFPASWFPRRRSWMIESGIPVQYDDDDNPFFWFPNGSPGVNYLETPTNGPVRGPTVSIAYTITAVGSPFFDYRTRDDNMNGDGKGKCRLMIRRKGDNWTAKGEYEHYRFWSTVAWKYLEPGSYLLQADLDPSKWTSIYGKRGDQVHDAFMACLNEAEWLTVTFGGGSSYGHGVVVTGGSGMFRVDSIYY